MKGDAILLLQKLIETPSPSGAEEQTAKILGDFLNERGVPFLRKGNNIWATNRHYRPSLPSVLLNSHHDTVKPNQGYTKNPHEAIVENGKLYGLGSNDAGGCLVSLLAAFLYFFERKLPYNLIFAASAEEEISGKNGMESLIHELPELELAIVGEPTLLQMAIAERGLLVIDATVKGRAGHAARNEGENAIYKAVEDIQLVKNYQFRKKSDFLGKNKVTATVIRAGSQHNVVPDICTYTLDVRVTDAYTLEEALEELQGTLKADLRPRSLRLKSSRINPNHRIVHVAKRMGLILYGSPTLSDQALIPYSSVKIGPGDSARSHTPDEFIFVEEIKEGIELYIELLKNYFESRT